jgi:hypothetical protein
MYVQFADTLTAVLPQISARFAERLARVLSELAKIRVLQANSKA